MKYFYGLVPNWIDFFQGFAYQAILLAMPLGLHKLCLMQVYWAGISIKQEGRS